MAITSAGIGSGLKVDELVSQLMSVERAPIALLDKKEAAYQAKLSSYGTLKSSFSALQTAAKALSTPDKFTPSKATVADSTVLAASASAASVPGAYNVEVVSLAASQKLMMNASSGGGYSAASSVVGEGVITFNFGTYVDAPPATEPTFTGNPDKSTPKTVTIGAGNNTLAGVRDAINAANVGVSASIINDGTPNGFRLSLTSTDSGVRNAMQISVAGAAGTLGELGQLAYDPSVAGASKMSQNVAAADAVIKVDNITIVKPSNTITDAIQGVTLNLSKTMPAGTTTKITVARDSSNVKTSIEAFVKAYNDVNAAIKTATSFDPATGKSAVLTGDSTVRSLQAQLRASLSSPVAGAPKGSAILSDAGIKFNKDGVLEIDTAKLDATIADPAKDIGKLFSSAPGVKGYAWQMDVLVGKMLSPVGPLADRASSVNESIKRLSDQRDAMSTRLGAIEQRYRKQFTALDTLIASMTTTSSYLAQQLSAISNNR